VIDDLARIGLRSGDKVRFRKITGGRWIEATVVGLEKDGSVALRDPRGHARSIRFDRLEVKGEGPRGAVMWEAVAERAARTEQLRFL
jgi:hypothetical protein